MVEEAKKWFNQENDKSKATGGPIVGWEEWWELLRKNKPETNLSSKLNKWLLFILTKKSHRNDILRWCALMTAYPKLQFLDKSFYEIRPHLGRLKKHLDSSAALGRHWQLSDNKIGVEV